MIQTLLSNRCTKGRGGAAAVNEERVNSMRMSSWTDESVSQKASGQIMSRSSSVTVHKESGDDSNGCCATGVGSREREWGDAVRVCRRGPLALVSRQTGADFDRA